MSIKRYSLVRVSTSEQDRCLIECSDGELVFLTDLDRIISDKDMEITRLREALACAGYPVVDIKSPPKLWTPEAKDVGIDTLCKKAQMLRKGDDRND